MGAGFLLCVMTESGGRMNNSRWHCALICVGALLLGGAFPPALAAQTPPDLHAAALTLLAGTTRDGYSVRDATSEGDALTVCLSVPLDALAANNWMGAEQVVEAVRAELLALPWQRLSVQAWDEESGTCKPLSDFAAYPPATQPIEDPMTGIPLPMSDLAGAGANVSETAAAYPLSLAGRTVYLSAGHGWNWTGSSWRTQRPVYQGFIEDHNNAEVVTQYLIPYLENAGATVVYTRERDWSEARVIADNDAGSPVFTKTGWWVPGASGPGYAGGSYLFAITDASGAPTAQATWSLSVPAQGRYAVYAWVYPGQNRVRDAHYTVHHAGGATEVIIDQSVHPRTWRYLGTFPFYAGAASVTLDNRTSDPAVPRAVIADAIRLGGGSFDSFSGIPLRAPNSPMPVAAPVRPWWETGAFYWTQWSGLDPNDTSLVPYLNDIVARPIFARWYERTDDADGVFVSWHTNGSNGTVRGTVSYVHNGETLPLTPGSKALQTAVHSELVSDIRAGWDASWPDLGKRSLNLGELRMLYDANVSSASIPGVLLEIAFHDNYDDALALKDPVFARLTARAVYQGIVRYFEGRDGVNLVFAPEPPTHLRVENVGSGQLRVSWSPSPVDGIGGEAATGYRIATSPDGFAWQHVAETSSTSLTLSGLAPGQLVFVRVTATNAGGESMPTEVLGARVGNARLLLVNGFDRLDRFGLVREVDPVEGTNLRMWIDQINSFGYVVHHGQAIPNTYAWDSASNEAVQSGAVSLLTYSVVDWILGEESSIVDGSFNSTERSLITAYLSAGRGLLVSGSEFAWHLEALGGGPDFLHDQLRTGFVADDAGTYTVQSVAGAAFASLGTLHFDAPGEYDVDYPDVLAPLAGAQTALTYVNASTPGAAAIQYAQGCQRVLTLGFPIETLRHAERAQLMPAALTFLDACWLDTAITSPADGVYLNGTPTLRGTATGAGLSRVELQLLNLSRNEYWNGSTWSAAPSWFAASGIQEWSYTFLAWSDGHYRLQARAVGATTDPSPAEVTFVLDRIAPVAYPVVLTPTGGISLQGPLIPLQWTPLSQDSGSPLLYGVQLDGSAAVRRFAGSPASVGLGNGVHTWRVRTEDAAGNVSGWSAIHTFSVYGVKQAFLPLIMKQP